MSDFTYPVSRETILKHKEVFKDLLFHWNKQINLVQQNSLEEFEERHWNDSIQLLPYINNHDQHILDLGSGGGFPGIVLGIHGFTITLSEVVEKKIIFLREIIRACNLTNCLIVNDAHSVNHRFDCVTARAFSSLKNILDIQINVSRETTKGLYLKGEKHLQEIEEASQFYSFDYRIHPSQTSKDGVIIEVSNLKKK